MNGFEYFVGTPWLLWILVASTVLYTLLKQAAGGSEFVAQLLGPLGRRWSAARAARRDAVTLLAELSEKVVAQETQIQAMVRAHDANLWVVDLCRQVNALDVAVSELRKRGQIVDAFLVYDEEWHRRELLAIAAGDGRIPEVHKSYLEFEHEWITAAHNRRKEDKEGSGTNPAGGSVEP